MSAWNPAFKSMNEAHILPPEIVALSIKKAKRPLFVIGSLLNKSLDEIVLRCLEIVENLDITLVATGGFSLNLSRIDMEYQVIGLIELINYLKDPKWKGFDGNGQYDLVCFIGVPYYLGSQGLSTLKNFAPHIRTITLCRYMHPNANISFPNMSNKEWTEWLDKLKDNI